MPIDHPADAVLGDDRVQFITGFNRHALGTRPYLVQVPASDAVTQQQRTVWGLEDYLPWQSRQKVDGVVGEHIAPGAIPLEALKEMVALARKK